MADNENKPTDEMPEIEQVSPGLDLDAELAGEVQQEFEIVKLYLTFGKFGQTFRAGSNPRQPMAIFEKGVLEIERSPENAGLIRLLIKMYKCTTNLEKAKETYKEFLESLPKDDKRRDNLKKLG